MDDQTPNPIHLTRGERDRLILRLRAHGRTLQEVADIVGLSRERVRQIEREHGGGRYDGRKDPVRRAQRVREHAERRVGHVPRSDGTAWSDGDLVAAVELTWELLGRVPKREEYLRIAPQHDWPCASMIDQRLGWNNAVAQAHAARHHR